MMAGKGRKAQKAVMYVQYGALPYRESAAGPEILLITSRRTHRWIIPKGWPMTGLEPYRSAAYEAYEEAGVRGRVAVRPLGSYTYDKFVDKKATTVRCEIRVFKLNVEFQEEDWPERGQREVRWFGVAEAIAITQEPGLKELLSKFGQK